MRRSLIIAVCLVFALQLGCTIIGDSVVNGTSSNARVRVEYDNGKTTEINLPPHTRVGERRKSLKDPGERIRSIVVLGGSNQRIAALDVKDIPNLRGKYGKYLTILIAEEGVYPVPDKYLDDAKFWVRKREIINLFHQEQRWERENPFSAQ